MSLKPQVPGWERRLVGAIVKTFWMRGNHGREWAVPEGLDHFELTFEGNSGGELHGRYFPLQDRPVHGVVVLVHPHRRYAQHWFVKEGHVPWLLDQGFEVLTFDLTTYGKSRGPATYFFEDVLAAVEVAKKEGGGVPVHVWGVSLGAFAAAVAASGMDGVESLILESPYRDFREWIPVGVEAAVNRAFLRLFPRTAEAIDAYPAIRAATPRRILVAAVADDEVTPTKYSRALAEQAPKGRTTYLEVNGVAHLALFGESVTYREAVLGVLGVKAMAPREQASVEVAA